MPGSGGRKDPSENSLHTKGIYCDDHETNIDSFLREIYDAYEAALPLPSNRDGRLANYVPKDTVKTKRPPDLATRMMLEQCGNPYPKFLHIHILVVYSMYISAHVFPCLQLLCALDHSLMHASLAQEP